MSGEENINNFDALWKSRIITKYKLEHFIKEFDKEIKPTDLKTLMKSNKFNISKYIFNNAFLRNKLKEVKLEYFENIQTPVKSVNLSKLGLSKNLTEEEKDNFENPNFNIGDHNVYWAGKFSGVNSQTGHKKLSLKYLRTGPKYILR